MVQNTGGCKDKKFASDKMMSGSMSNRTNDYKRRTLAPRLVSDKQRT